MTPQEALSNAIFGINTLLHPDATLDEDFSKFEAQAEDTLNVLVQLREGRGNAAYRQAFINLFNDVAACEAPEGTQVDDVLEAHQEAYDKAKS